MDDASGSTTRSFSLALSLSLPRYRRLASVCTVKNRVSNATAWISPFEVSTTHGFVPKNLAASTPLKRRLLSASTTGSLCAPLSWVHTQVRPSLSFSPVMLSFHGTTDWNRKRKTMKERCGGGARVWKCRVGDELLFGIPVTRRIARNICPRSVTLATELPLRTD